MISKELLLTCCSLPKNIVSMNSNNNTFKPGFHYRRKHKRKQKRKQKRNWNSTQTQTERKSSCPGRWKDG